MKKKFLYALIFMLTAFGGNCWGQQEEIAYKDRQWDLEQKCIRDPSVFSTLTAQDIPTDNTRKRDMPEYSDISLFLCRDAPRGVFIISNSCTEYHPVS